jgi:uncharacterized protein YndB with AHSA1/START domain
VADSVSATRVIDAPVESVFALLADTARHAAIDGTGWVRASADGETLTAAGQVFRMSMYHPQHPDRIYVTANQVNVFDPPNAIAWQTGYEDNDGMLHFGGWFWRYDLARVGPSNTEVRLTYDWSATSEATRELIGFPPFPPEHLSNSLGHLRHLVDS